jgi:CubicO group peptidase (beta-lactamase class C family)
MRPKILRLVTLLALLTLVLTACTQTTATPTPTQPAATATPAQSVYWPTQGWRTSTPEQQGMDSERLVQAMDYLLEQEEFRIHSLSLVRNGYLVLDAYFYPFQAGWKHDLASVTKSWTATLVGAALQQGFIESLEQPVLGFFPGRSVANRDARKEAITVEDLLAMRSGLECVTAPTEVTLQETFASPDWVQFSLDRPMAAAPGQSWVYDSPAVHLLQGILQQAAGMDTLDFARQYLFDSLGISDVAWLADPQGINTGYGDLRLNPHDAAKLGVLYLQDGVWEGQRLLPEGWVDAATQPSGSSYDYGYLWWLSPGYYSARGRGGQRVVVVPEEEMVMVVTGGGGSSGTAIDRLLSSYILPACRSTAPLPANDDAVAVLQSKIEQAAAVPPFEPLPLPPLPQMAQFISGQTYALHHNSVALTHMTLTFYEPDEAGLRITTAGGPAGTREWEWRVGLDDVPRTAPGRYGLPALAKGRWTDDHTFSLQVDEIGNNHQWELTLTFQGDSLAATMVDLAGFFTEPIRMQGKLAP